MKVFSKFKWALPLALVMVFIVIVTTLAATVQIDSFQTTTLGSALTSEAGTETAIDSPVGEAIGGVRDYSVTHQQGGGAVSLEVDTVAGQLSFASASNTRGSFSVRWDGNAVNNTPNLNTYINDSGNNDGFLVSIYADQTSWSMQIDVRDQADTTTASYSFTENQDIRGTGRVYYIPFSAFTNSSVLTSLTNPIGAIDVSITGVNDLDLTIAFFDSVDISENFVDLGDLPAIYGMTTLAENGAGHLYPGTTIQMGPLVDGESEGQTSVDADGDDNLNLADEDGVTFNGLWNDFSGDADIEIVGTVNGCVSAWLDWNSGSFGPFAPNGSFNDILEHIIDNQPVTPGTNSFNFTIGNFVPTATLYARFRVVPDRDNDGNCSDQDPMYPTSFADDGEVEDYQITFRPTAITLTNIEAESNTSLLIATTALLLVLISGGAVLVYKRSRV